MESYSFFGSAMYLIFHIAKELCNTMAYLPEVFLLSIKKKKKIWNLGIPVIPV